VAAVVFLASLSGPIDIFYGTETGLANGAPKAGFVDAGRIPMPWKSLNENLMGQVRQALETRRAHPALSRGGRIPLLADRDQLVMAKVAPGETVLVGVNLASEPREVTVDVSGLLPVGTPALQPALGDAPASIRAETGQLKWRLPALSTVLVSVPTAAPGR
jgi:glycosidase